MNESMLDYYIEKYGIEEAFEDYAPPTWRGDPVAHAALMQIKIGKTALQQRIRELSEGGEQA